MNLKVNGVAVYALDCGIEVNADLMRAQVEGGLLFGLSAAAWGEVNVR
jgi:isoquinoline 1-oxidoreductase subunit beta